MPNAQQYLRNSNQAKTSHVNNNNSIIKGRTLPKLWYPTVIDGERACMYDNTYPLALEYANVPKKESLLYNSREECCANFPTACSSSGSTPSGATSIEEQRRQIQVKMKQQQSRGIDGYFNFLRAGDEKNLPPHFRSSFWEEDGKAQRVIIDKLMND